MIGSVRRLECIMPCLTDLRGTQQSFRVLALDTTAAVCSVALHVRQGGNVAMHHRQEPLTPGQSRSVLEMIDAVLAEGKIDDEARGTDRDGEAQSNPTDEPLRASPVDLIGFGAGPGAFTGLRVACGVAQGLALGWACRVVPVDSLTTLAWQAAHAEHRSSPTPHDAMTADRPNDAQPHPASEAQQQISARLGPGAPIVVVLDVRMNEVAFALFDPPPNRVDGSDEPTWPQAVLGPALWAPEQAAHWIGDRLSEGGALRFAGDAFRVYPALAQYAPEAGAEQPQAWAVADLALMAGLADRAIDPAEAVPFYLRDKVALDRREQEQLRAARRAPGS